MTTKLVPTLNEVNDLAMDALLKALGPVDMIRFLRQFEHGSGDYTKDRHQWLDDVPFDDFAADVSRIQEEGKAINRRRQRPMK